MIRNFGYRDVTLTCNVPQEIMDDLEPQEYYLPDFDPTPEYKENLLRGRKPSRKQFISQLGSL